MKTLLPSLLAFACLMDCATSQVQDVGLTMDAGPLTVIFGQDCGPFACQPFFGGMVAGGETRNLVHYGAPTSLYVVAIGFPATCAPVPGFDNGLLLSSPLVLGFGLTSAPPIVPLPCQQGLAFASFTLPTNVAPGILFRVQSIGFSLSGVLAFSPAIEALTA